MIVIDQKGAALPPDGGTALALGYFDGVHLGHRAVLNAALDCAGARGLQPAVFTFSQGVALKGKSILSPTQKHRALQELGLKYCFEPPFESFRALPPNVFFTEMLLGEYKAQALFCGEDYTFGAQRAGTPELLQTLCARHGVSLAVVPTALWQGQAVSSSRIRAALQAGDIPAANTMLGRPFEIDFPVIHGKGLGHTLGFPTINQIFPSALQAPKQGVYITQAVINGRAYPATTGFGTRPTVDDDTALTCETFITGFSGDLYGCSVRVRFYKRVSDTLKFSGVEQLGVAVHKWAAQAQDFFAEKREKQG